MGDMSMGEGKIGQSRHLFKKVQRTVTYCQTGEEDVLSLALNQSAAPSHSGTLMFDTSLYNYHHHQSDSTTPMGGTTNNFSNNNSNSVWQEVFVVLKANMLFLYESQENRYPFLSIYIEDVRIERISHSGRLPIPPRIPMVGFRLTLNSIYSLPQSFVGQRGVYHFLSSKEVEIDSHWLPALHRAKLSNCKRDMQDAELEVVRLKQHLLKEEASRQQQQLEFDKEKDLLENRLLSLKAKNLELVNENKRLKDRDATMTLAADELSRSREAHVKAIKNELDQINQQNIELNQRNRQLEADLKAECDLHLKKSRENFILKDQLHKLDADLSKFPEAPDAMARKLNIAERRCTQAEQYVSLLKQKMLKMEEDLFETQKKIYQRVEEVGAIFADDSLIELLQAQVDLLNWRLYYVESDNLTANEELDVKKRLKILIQEMVVAQTCCEANSLKLRSFILNEQIKHATEPMDSGERNVLLPFMQTLLQRHNRALDYQVAVPTSHEEANAIKKVWGPRVRFIRVVDGGEQLQHDHDRMEEGLSKEQQELRMYQTVRAEMRGRPPRQGFRMKPTKQSAQYSLTMPVIRPVDNATLAQVNGITSGPTDPGQLLEQVNTVKDSAVSILLGEWLASLPVRRVDKSKFAEAERKAQFCEKEMQRHLDDWQALSLKYDALIRDYRRQESTAQAAEGRANRLESELNELRSQQRQWGMHSDEDKFLSAVAQWN